MRRKDRFEAALDHAEDALDLAIDIITGTALVLVPLAIFFFILLACWGPLVGAR